MMTKLDATKELFKEIQFIIDQWSMNQDHPDEPLSARIAIEIAEKFDIAGTRIALPDRPGGNGTSHIA